MKLSKNDVSVAKAFQVEAKKNVDMRVSRKGIHENQVKNVRKYAKAFDVLPVCFVMASSGYDATTMNTKGSSNPYTLKKACELALFMAGNVARPDNYDVSAFKTAYALAKAGLHFTAMHLKASLLREFAVYVPEAERQYLSDHHSCKDGTVGTQVSSSMNNLASFGIISAVAGSKEGWQVNLEAYATKLLATRLGLIAKE